MSLDLTEWVGRTRSTEDVISPWSIGAMYDILDRTSPDSVAGSTLPPLWHWLCFTHSVPRSQLGPDGHERRGAFLPPVALPRRMWAGGSVRFLGPVVVGEPATLTSTVLSVEEKEGRSGRLVFVRVGHQVTQDSATTPLLDEEQILVYRDPAEDSTGGASGEGRGSGGTAQTAGGSANSGAADEPSPTPDWAETVTPNNVTLFQFSALTYNAHRIHYDQEYAVQHEGYRGLLVHAPLTALLLLDAAVQHGAEPHEYVYRATAPLFGGEPISLTGRDEDGVLRLEARNADGVLSMKGAVT